jgi:hypothetical protein
VQKQVQGCSGHKKAGLPFPGNPAVSFRVIQKPVAFRPRLAAGLAFASYRQVNINLEECQVFLMKIILGIGF